MSRKGQWFIISAVLASATFLAISILFKGYFSLDSSRLANIDDDFFLFNVISQLNTTAKYSSDTAEFRMDVEDFIAYAEKKAIEKGYFLFIRNTSAMNPGGTNFIISIATQNMNITRAIRIP